jgi:hypothetical protein
MSPTIGEAAIVTGISTRDVNATSRRGRTRTKRRP